MNMEGDGDHWFTGWEDQCAKAIEEQPDYEQALGTEDDNAKTKLWTSFQDSATAVAQLYRDRSTGEPTAIWVQFQTAAGTVTSLYREASESLKKAMELGKLTGYQKRNKELLSWAKRKKRLIHREDLLSYLSGKPPLPRQNHLHHHHNLRLSPRPRNTSPPPGMGQADSLVIDANLHTFREALAGSPISCRPRGSDLCAFITGEIARHCKRPASPSDVPMGSPTHPKRSRYM